MPSAQEVHKKQHTLPGNPRCSHAGVCHTPLLLLLLARSYPVTQSGGMGMDDVGSGSARRATAQSRGWRNLRSRCPTSSPCTLAVWMRHATTPWRDASPSLTNGEFEALLLLLRVPTTSPPPLHISCRRSAPTSDYRLVTPPWSNACRVIVLHCPCGTVAGVLTIIAITIMLGIAAAVNVTSTERQALADLFTATSGASWTNSTGWTALLAGGDPCSPTPAAGVTCTSTNPNHIGFVGPGGQTVSIACDSDAPY